MTKSPDAAPVAFDRHVAGCIYCGRLGPYTDEHVVSAGLGGDDPDWMLRGCVCTICNNHTFSRIEAHVLKESHVALMRLYSQPSTRDGTPPSPLQAKTTIQLGDGSLVAGNLGAGGQADVMAQILRGESDDSKSAFPIIGPDRPAIEALLASLQELLQDDVVLIEKHLARSFASTRLTWVNNGYLAGSSVITAKPPAVGIWFEPAHMPETLGATPPWSVFRRPQGQIVGRAPDLKELALFLSELRPNMIEISRAFAVASTATTRAQPGVHMRMKVRPLEVDRVLVKIGINLTAHLFGLEVVRRSEFDGAIAFALGNGSPLRQTQFSSGVFTCFPGGRHVFCLTTSRTPTGGKALVLSVRIYGVGNIENFILAELHDSAIQVRQVAVVVDYAANRIQVVD